MHRAAPDLTLVSVGAGGEGGVERLRREASADGDDNQTPRSLIFRQIKRQGKAGSGTAGLL